MEVAINTWFQDQPATGSGQYVQHLLSALANLKPHSGFQPIAPRSGIKSRPFSNIYKVWFEQIAFPQMSTARCADVAHVPYFASPIHSAIPTVVTVHDLIPVVLPAYRGSLLVRAYMQLVAAGARRTDRIIADSECSKRDIIAHLRVKPERVHAIPLAAGPQFRAATLEDIDRVRSRYRLPDKYVLYLGGFDRRKNVPKLLKAFAWLQDQRTWPTNIKLVIAGRLPERNARARSCSTAGKVLSARASREGLAQPPGAHPQAVWPTMAARLRE